MHGRSPERRQLLPPKNERVDTAIMREHGNGHGAPALCRVPKRRGSWSASLRDATPVHRASAAGLAQAAACFRRRSCVTGAACRDRRLGVRLKFAVSPVSVVRRSARSGSVGASGAVFTSSSVTSPRPGRRRRASSSAGSAVPAPSGFGVQCSGARRPIGHASAAPREHGLRIDPAPLAHAGDHRPAGRLARGLHGHVETGATPSTAALDRQDRNSGVAMLGR